jgi:glutamate racemase
MSRKAAIGIFDSGVGGLTVVHALLAALPAEHLVYLGDTGRTPYGTKSAETVTRYSLENVDFLLARSIKLLVVACNTASSVALDAIAARAGVPVVGVIEPGARAAVEHSRSRRVEVYTRACPLFVPLAEEGWIDGSIVRQVADTYLASLARSGIDTLILGCTHYPLLRRTIAESMGEGVALVDSAEETAREVRAVLEREALARPDGAGSASFFVTDVPDRFVRIGQHFLGSRVQSAVRIER